MLISNFKISFIENSELSEDLINKIIRIKQNYWDYSYESHKKWMTENINDGEHHLILQGDNEEIIAYLNIIKTHIIYDEIKEEVMGIGNVCVEQSASGQGIGQILMCLCNYYLGFYNKRAILLCKEYLVEFYKKLGWTKYNGDVNFRDEKYQGIIMFTESLKAPSILIVRNF